VASNTQTIALSDEAILVYVLRDSGLRGQLMAGRVERTESGQLSVFDGFGSPFAYLSGGRIRSWCIFGRDGTPMEEWREVQSEDLSKIPSNL
jgi:hypothetical protein